MHACWPENNRLDDKKYVVLLPKKTKFDKNVNMIFKSFKGCCEVKFVFFLILISEQALSSRTHVAGIRSVAQ